MNIKRKFIALLLSVFFLTLWVGICQAQDPGDPSADDPAAPVDGGISLLLAAGAAYGVRRIKRRGE